MDMLIKYFSRSFGFLDDFASHPSCTNQSVPRTKPCTRFLMSRRQCIILSAKLAPLLFLASYFYQLALVTTTAGVVNVLSSTQSLSTLILAALWPAGIADTFNLTKLVAVLLSFTGAILVERSDPSHNVSSTLDNASMMTNLLPFSGFPPPANQALPGTAWTVGLLGPNNNTPPAPPSASSSLNFLSLGSLFAIISTLFFAVFVLLVQHTFLEKRRLRRQLKLADCHRHGESTGQMQLYTGTNLEV
ncbi:unnamed protein product [Protopolystoma xenopodis]|uniref:Solute carrier family 35 member F5 n=1 Tax=Protopolystoma xenopodis TaxID=117903 RepID=A0A448XH89_9PLAT|nr:unnamed protein product [Protopolystoma xenopodis]